MQVTKKKIGQLSELFKRHGFEDPRRPLQPHGTIDQAMRAAARILHDALEDDSTEEWTQRIEAFGAEFDKLFPDIKGVDLLDQVTQFYTAVWPDDPPTATTTTKSDPDEQGPSC